MMPASDIGEGDPRASFVTFCDFGVGAHAHPPYVVGTTLWMSSQTKLSNARNNLGSSLGWLRFENPDVSSLPRITPICRRLAPQHISRRIEWPCSVPSVRLWNWSKFRGQPWHNKLYRSWLKIMYVEVSNGPAVVATQSHCSYGQLLFNFRPVDCEHIAHTPIPDHSAASRTFRGPIHLVGHLKPRGPQDRRGRTRI
jgi:hypothetical protein